MRHNHGVRLQLNLRNTTNLSVIVPSAPANTKKHFTIPWCVVSVFADTSTCLRYQPMTESLILGGKIHRIRVMKLCWIYMAPAPFGFANILLPRTTRLLSTVASSYRFLGAYCVNNSIIWGGKIHHIIGGRYPSTDTSTCGQLCQLSTRGWNPKVNSLIFHY